MKVGLKTKRFLFIAGISAFSFGLCLGVLNFKNKSPIKTNAEVVIDNSDAFGLNVEGQWSYRPDANYEIMFVTREFGNIYFSPTHVTRYITTNSADVRCDSYTLDDNSGEQTSIGVSANIHLDNINDPDTAGGFEISGNCSLVGNDIVAFWIADESMLEDSEAADPHITDTNPSTEYPIGWNYSNGELFYYNGETVFNNIVQIDLYDEYVEIHYSDIPGAAPQYVATLRPGGLNSDHSVKGSIDIDGQSTEVEVFFEGNIELNNYRTNSGEEELGEEELTSVTLNTHELVLDEGDTAELLYQFSPSSYTGTFEWHSNNENIATVSDKGRYAEVTAVGSGTATIYITSAEYPDIFDECVVTVNEQSYISYMVTYDPNGAEGDPATDFTSMVLEGDAAIYNLLHNMFDRPNYNFLGWSTDSSSLTANYEEGEQVYIWADTRYYAIWEYQEPETQVEITSLVLPENLPSYYNVGDYIDFSNIILVANYSDGSTKEVTSNEYVAFFSPEGECDPYQPLVSGDYVLYFSYEGATTETGFLIYVNEREPETYATEIRIVKGSELIEGLNLQVGESVDLDVVPYPDNSICEVSWSSSNDNVVQVDQNGNVIANGPGTATIIVSDLNNYAADASIEVQVSQVTPQTTFVVIYNNEPVTDTVNIPLGAPVEFGVEVTPSDAAVELVWTSDVESVATIENGLLTPKSTGTTIITVMDMNSQYSLTFPVTVSAAPTGGWTYTGEDLSYYDPAYPNALLRREFAVLYESGWEIVKVRYAFVDIETDEVIDYKWVTLTSASYQEGTSGYTVTGSFSQVPNQRINLNLDSSEVYIPEDGVAYYTYNNAIFPSANTAWDSSGGGTFCDMVASSATYDSNSQFFTAVFNLVNPETGSAKTQTQSIEVRSAVVTPWPAEGKYVLVDGYLYGDTTRPATFYIESALINQSADVINELYISVGGEVTDEVTIHVGDLLKVDAVYSPEDAEVELTWSSGQDSIAYIGPNGYLEGTGEGQTTIFVYEANSGLEASCIVTVEADETSPMVYFDANGGEGEMSPMPAQEMMIYAPECSFYRDGYTFECWETDTGVTYLPGQKVENITSDITLYARWIPSDPTKVIISFDANGGDGIMPDIILEDGTFEIPGCEFEWGDHTFVYWKTDKMEIYLPGRVVENITESFTLYAVWREETQPVPLPVESKISEDTINDIKDTFENLELDESQSGAITSAIDENKDYISDETGTIIASALAGTSGISDDQNVAEAQKDLIVAVVQVGVEVDSGKAADIATAQKIEEGLLDDFLSSEMKEFYELQMQELFGGNRHSRTSNRADSNNYSIDIDPGERTGGEAVNYLYEEADTYRSMNVFVDDTVERMSKSAAKLRQCSGEAVTTEVKSYVERIKVISFRAYPAEEELAAFVEELYKAMMLSMQNQVIEMLTKDHKPDSNKMKEEHYQKELAAVKDYEQFEIMVQEVLRQKYVALTGDESTYTVENLELFKEEIFDPIFKSWALDEDIPEALKEKGINFTLEELTQATIEEATGKSQAFVVNEKLTDREWGFIAGIAGGAVVIVSLAAVIPTVLKKKRAKEGNK